MAMLTFVKNFLKLRNHVGSIRVIRSEAADNNRSTPLNKSLDTNAYSQNEIVYLRRRNESLQEEVFALTYKLGGLKSDIEEKDRILKELRFAREMITERQQDDFLCSVRCNKKKKKRCSPLNKARWADIPKSRIKSIKKFKPMPMTTLIIDKLYSTKIDGNFKNEV